MKGEIDRDFYCAARRSYTGNGEFEGYSICLGANRICIGSCQCYHRKWPTPEQFFKEYGKVYPDGGAVYVRECPTMTQKTWAVWSYKKAKEAFEPFIPIVCACTPWGKPPNDWRPE